MHVALSWLLTILWCICYPIGILIYYIFTFVLNVLHLLYRPIAFILQPVVYLGRFIFAVLALPFRLLARLEPLYNYVGVAALLGVCGGLCLFYIYNVLHRLLRLDSASNPEPIKARTAKEYRQDKARSKRKTEPFVLPPAFFNAGADGLSQSPPGVRNRNLLDQTIMEEMDSDY